MRASRGREGSHSFARSGARANGQREDRPVDRAGKAISRRDLELRFGSDVPRIRNRNGQTVAV